MRCGQVPPALSGCGFRLALQSRGFLLAGLRVVLLLESTRLFVSGAAAPDAEPADLDLALGLGAAGGGDVGEGVGLVLVGGDVAATAALAAAAISGSASAVHWINSGRVSGTARVPSEAIASRRFSLGCIGWACFRRASAALFDSRPAPFSHFSQRSFWLK